MDNYPLPTELASSPFIRSIPPDLDNTHACETAIGYKFSDPWLLWEALQAPRSWPCLQLIPRYEKGNMRLAIVGDRILDFLLALKWYPTYQKRGMCNPTILLIYTCCNISKGSRVCMLN